MAISSKINIDVESGAFAEFKAAFDKYSNALDKLPGTWNAVGRASSTARTNFENAANSMKIVGSSFAAINASGKDFYQVTVSCL